MLLYIDPGTGSMLFTVLVGILGAGIYGLRSLTVKMRFAFSGGKCKEEASDALPFVIYSDDKRYWNLFGPICREFEKRNQEAVYLTSSPDDPALKESFRHVSCRFIGEGNKGYAKLNMLHADVFLCTTPGLDVYQWRRSKDVKCYVHILHMVSDATLYRMYGLDYFDAVLLSGDYQIRQIRQLEQQRKLKEKELLVVGQPYMDALKARIDSTPVPEHQGITVLLAPSWGPSSILNRYGDQAIDALLATGHHIIVRPHPQSFSAEKELMDRLMQKYPQVEWNRDNDNFDVLNRSDILISDFSGVMFDFALAFEKPVIYADTSFDDAPYDAHWLEEPLWTFQALKQIGKPLDDLSNIGDLIDSCLGSDACRQGIREARNQAWQHIGSSAALTVDYLLKKRDRVLKEGSHDAR